MRDYFTSLLINLDKLTGIQQYNKLMQMSDWKEEINLLLDILCRVCDQFPFIPDDAKQRIVEAALVKDKDFIGLNARWLYRQLESNKDRYFKELAHQEVKPEDAPLEGEAFKKKTDWVIAELSKISEPMVARINPYKDIVVPSAVKETHYHAPDPSVSLLQDLKMEYGRLHTDKYTGKPLPGSPTFEQWVKEKQQEK